MLSTVLIEPSQEATQVNKVPSALDRCNQLSNIAKRIGNPGKGKPMAPSGGARTTVNGKEKTGRPAPNLALLAMLLAALPNHPGGPYHHRDAWMALCHAVKGAAMAGGFEAEARASWLEWCARFGGDPTKDAEAWDGVKMPHTGWGFLLRELQVHNPNEYARVRHAEAKAAFAHAPIDPCQLPLLMASPTQVAIASAVRSATFGPVQPLNPSAIPPRCFLYGNFVIGTNITVIVAPGGTGKSALIMVEVVAMATGRELLAGDQPRRRLKVWMHNGEDSDDEQQRRLAAAMKFHGVTPAELAGWLFMTSGRSMKITLARQGKDGPELVPGMVEALIECITTWGIEVLVLDPLGAFHTLPENSNEAANVLMDGLRQVAHRTGVAIVLVHHTSKVAARDMEGAGAGASRGASAFVDAARAVRQLIPLNPKDADKFGVPRDEAWRYVGIANGKANLAPPSARKWIKLESVNLGNGTPEYPEGDNVQTVSRWVPPAQAGVTQPDLRRVQQAIAANPYRARAVSTAEEWVGYLIAEVLGLDIGAPGTKAEHFLPTQTADRNEVARIIAEGLACGALIKVEDHDPTARKPRPFIRVGKPVPDAEAEVDENAPG